MEHKLNGRGYAKLYRDVLDQDFFKATNVGPIRFAIYGQLCLRVWHVRKTILVSSYGCTEEVTLEPNQCIIGTNKTPLEWGISRSKFRAQIAALAKAGFLTLTPARNYTLVTLCHAVSYGEPGTQPGHHAGNGDAHHDNTPVDNNTSTLARKHVSTLARNQETSCPRNTHFSDDDMKFALWMVKTLRDRLPDLKEPSLPKWANCIRLIREVDGKTHKQMSQLFLWAQRDDFWYSNIMSPAKLRKQWDRLQIQIDQGSSKGLK